MTEENDTISIATENEESITRCLNCGTEVFDKFCPHCGQSTSVPKKLNNKTFGKSVWMSFARLNPGFLNTFLKLIYKPWEVISDYIHGKQVGYSHPISMLIQFTLYSTFIMMFLEGILEVELLVKQQFEEGTPWLIRALKDSTVVRVLWISVPVIFAAYLAYWNHGSRRFTFSEYIIGALYLVITIRIYDFLFTPINYFLNDSEPISDYRLFYIGIVALFFGSITLFKAFPIRSQWKGVMLFIGFVAMSIIFLLTYHIFFTWIDDFIMGKDMSNWIDNYFAD